MIDPPPAVEYRVARSGNVLFSVVVLVIIAVMGGINAHEARMAADRVNRAAECVIEQFAEHRFATRAAHQSNADAHGYTYPVEPEDLPEAVLDRLQEACAPFTKR